jgi:DNA invertase Pin-like site-specific DNA recombinase
VSKNTTGSSLGEVGFSSLHEALDTTGGRLVFHVFAALAEFIRELILEGGHEGLVAARARGPPRPTPALTPSRSATPATCSPAPATPSPRSCGCSG